MRDYLEQLERRLLELADERDEARREAEELRAENERLLDAGCVLDEAMDSGSRERESARRTWRSTCQSARCPLTCPHGDQCTLEREHARGHNHRGCDCNEPSQPAPQTHFRPGDLVLDSSGVAEHRLSELDTMNKVGEQWREDTGSLVLIQADRNPILERDGTPTDEGLRRLAEKAGYSYTRSDIYGTDCLLICIGTREVVHHGHPDARQKSEAAAALREMGGA